MSLLPAFGTPAGEATRAGLVAAGFAMVFVGAETWRRVAHPPAEWTRKLVHIGGGLIVATFPWLFASHLTVAAVALAATAALAVGRWRGLLPSVSAVERSSAGDLVFPFAGYLLFVLAAGRPVFYVISLATLVVADALAALIGKAYGRIVYRVGGGTKSLEGSLVFFIVTFLAVHLALLLGTELDRRACVLVAAQIALLVTSFEAISPHGSDNVFVPLGTLFLLIKTTTKDPAFLAGQLAAQVGLLLVTLALARTTGLLTLSGAVATHLVLYAAMSLGGWAWLAPPAAALAAYIVLGSKALAEPAEPDGRHEVRTIFELSAVAVLCVFADNALRTMRGIESPEVLGLPLYALFVGSLAGPLAISGLNIFRGRYRVVSALAVALLATLLPGALAAPGEIGWRGGAAAIAIAVLAPAIRRGASRAFARPRASWSRSRFAAVSTLAAVSAVLAALASAP